MHHKQTLLRIGLPPGVRLYPTEFREMLARNPGMPNALFQVNEHRQPLNERPGIRTVGGGGWIGILADEDNKLVLREATGAALMSVSEHTGRACRVAIEEHDFGLKPLHEPNIYWVREMAIKRRHQRARDQDMESLIRDRALSSIEATCDKYGIDCPTPEDLGIEIVEVVHQRGLRLQTTKGVTNEYVTLVDAKLIQDRPGMRMETPRAGGVLQ